MTLLKSVTGCFLLCMLAHGQHYAISGMSKIEAQQKQEVWCWAAVIQIVARAERVPLDQQAVVVDVKGKLKVESADFDEITRYFRVGWHGSPGQPGTWTSDSLSFRIRPGVNGTAPAFAKVTRGVSTFDGAPPVEMMKVYFQIGRPMVLAYANSNGGGHAVVAYGGDFENTGRGIELKSIDIYDPLTGTEAAEEWRFFGRRLMGAWFPTIMLRDGCNAFTAGQAPDPRCASPVQGQSRVF